jgi:hypothetical protein
LCTELGPAQCYSTNRVGFRLPRRLPIARHVTARRAGAVPTVPARLRCRRRVSLLPPRANHATGPYCLRSPHAEAHFPFFIPPSLYSGASRAGHRVARRPVNQHHRPLLWPVTDGSPLPKLPRAPPCAPLPPVFLQPSHHPMRSPPMHRPSTARQQPPSTCGPRCHR